MLWLLSILIDVVSASIICVPVIVIMQNTLFEGTSLKRRVVTILFVAYFSAVLSIVGIPSINALTIDLSINIIPIVDMINGLKTTVLNIILFIPLGFLLPLIWHNFRSAKNTILFGFGLSLIIEISQIFTYRATDIDDLITNTAGTLLGYLIAGFVNDKWSNNFYLTDETQGNKELMCICGITFLVMFLIAPFISGALWEILLK
ncbi:MAG: VanZ family protein [Clostridia bacterium]|jgi:glycopeptide antibiotics resistance protein|nr:VanZ family protein [Clostridia bacterium]MCI2015591.1 VanZ family protein [Clostridia bacterium]